VGPSGIRCERARREATRAKILGLNKPHLVRVPAARIARLNTTPPTRSKCKMAMDTDSQSLRLRMEQGRQMAVEAGQITLQYFGRSIDILEKSDGSPVTIADQQAEQHLRRRIQNRFPGDGIVGEEFGIDEGESGFRWILDPIDGTKSFIAGVPLYGTMVGLEQDG